MADQGRWWKLWTVAPDSPELSCMTNADFGAWCKFGCYTKTHGTEGVLIIQRPPDGIAHPLQGYFQVASFDEIIACISRMHTCTISTVTSETNATVTYKIEWRNWWKYQGDFSGDRVKKHRAKMRESVTPKKRREEKRREESKKEPPPKEEQRTLPLPGVGPSNGTPITKRKPKKPTDPNVPLLIQHWQAEYLSCLGQSPVVVYGKHGVAAKTLLTGRTLEDAKDLITEYLRNPPRDCDGKNLYDLSHIVYAANRILARKAERVLS